MRLRPATLGCLLFLAGCASGTDLPKTIPVTGIVTYKGEPVDEASVSFIPKSGRPATGTTNNLGEFELTTFRQNDGALVGEHQVTIEKMVPKMGSEKDPYAELDSVLPVRYTKPGDSGLVANVSSDSTEFRFELTD
ncbi:hypothetical protein Pan216_19910 [Planctomycetes bacterium Pan216]|uniref:Carboxypeptidase regulatory-like domain-containing protein n=1 Tax=Kolteria novifilia TaxID=2527975 RepID=A0A518B2C8_9BACT|nr:hypothetical protein Pan216_19910 [Planctomycetes bacterium Pan216]